MSKMVAELHATTDSLPTSNVDKYEESIDLQNDCRSFYLNRIKASEQFKQTLNVQKTDGAHRKTTSMSTAMERLREEMASLVDQDLSLMKQLLKLNETIEELKTKRLYGVSKNSLEESVDDIGSSRMDICKSVSLLSVNSQHGSDSSIDIISTEEPNFSLQSTISYKKVDTQKSLDSGYGE